VGEEMCRKMNEWMYDRKCKERRKQRNCRDNEEIKKDKFKGGGGQGKK
jgi:hypothetical protein